MVGVVVSLIAGIAIGATLVANMIDANSLRQYQQNPKIVKLVTLRDDAAGNNVGWDPTSGNARGIDTSVFHILDSSVKSDSIVYANVIGVYTMRTINSDSVQDTVDVPCVTKPADGRFEAYCEYHEYTPRDGSSLKYAVIASR